MSWTPGKELPEYITKEDTASMLEKNGVKQSIIKKCVWYQPARDVAPVLRELRPQGTVTERDSERILVSAVRYALTLRRHYTIEDTVGYVRDRLPELSDWCRRTIARAIADQIRLFGEIPDTYFGEDRFVGGGVQYQAMWEKLLEELSAVS